MSEKKLPLPESEFLSLIKDVPTPFHIYADKAFKAGRQRALTVQPDA